MLNLFKFKDRIVDDAKSLKEILIQDDSLFGSQEVKNEQGFLKEIYYISCKIQKFPKTKDDLFKSPTV